MKQPKKRTSTFPNLDEVKLAPGLWVEAGLNRLYLVIGPFKKKKRQERWWLLSPEGRVTDWWV